MGMMNITWVSVGGHWTILEVMTANTSCNKMSISTFP